MLWGRLLAGKEAVIRILLGCALAVWFPGGATFANAAADAPHTPTILIVGDSLSAGYGVAVDATWVALLQQRLAREGYEHRVVNASVSGETTGGARARLPRALEVHDPALVVIELGGNDGLRGLPLKQVQDNLAAMIGMVHGAGARAVLVAMQIPTNYGPAYTSRFEAMYADLGQKYSVPVIEGFLESVALDERLMQADGIHPNTQAQPILLDVIWPMLSRQLGRRGSTRQDSSGGRQ